MVYFGEELIEVWLDVIGKLNFYKRFQFYG